MKNRFTSFLVDSWNALRWDIHEIVIPVLINALIISFVAPQLVPLPHASIPIAFYILWFVWNILTARTFAQLGFDFELLLAIVYFVLLLGCIGSLIFV